jgi:hypothetical protein
MLDRTTQTSAGLPSSADRRVDFVPRKALNEAITFTSLTKRSGEAIEQAAALLDEQLLNPIGVRPLYRLEQVFDARRFGSGYQRRWTCSGM